MSQLAFKPKLQPNESPISLLLRASELNGCVSLYYLCRAFGLKFMGQSYFGHLTCQPDKWLAFTDFDKDIIKNAPYLRKKRHSQHIHVRGIKSLASLVRLSNSAICPDCIIEKGYADYRWDFVFVTSCPTHNRYLLNSCPECKQMLKLNRKGLLICQCGKPVIEKTPPRIPSSNCSHLICELCEQEDKSTIEAAQSIFYSMVEGFAIDMSDNEQVDNLMLTILSAVDSRKDGEMLWQEYFQPLVQQGVHPRLACLPLLTSEHPRTRELGFTFIKKHSTHVTSNTPNLDLPPLTRKQAAIALGVSPYHVKKLENFIHSDDDSNQLYGDKINQLLHLFSTHNNAAKDLERISDVLAKPSNKWTLPLILDDLQSNNGPIKGMNACEGILSARIKPRTVKNVSLNSYVTLKQVAKNYSISYEILRHAVRGGWLRRVEKERTPGTTVYLRPSQVKEFFKTYNYSGQIARKLGVNNTNVAEKLMALGGFPVSGPAIDGSVSYLFKNSSLRGITKNDIEGLTDYPTRTGRGSPEKFPPPPLPGYSVAEAANLLKVSESRIRALVVKGDIKRLVGKHRQLRLEDESVLNKFALMTKSFSLPLSVVAPSVGLTPKRFLSLCAWDKKNAGYIQEGNAESYIHKKYFYKLAKFHKRFVTKSDAVQQYSITKRLIERWIRHDKLIPARTTPYRGVTVHYYQRKEVESLVNELNELTQRRKSCI